MSLSLVLEKNQLTSKWLPTAANLPKLCTLYKIQVGGISQQLSTLHSGTAGTVGCGDVKKKEKVLYSLKKIQPNLQAVIYFFDFSGMFQKIKKILCLLVTENKSFCFGFSLIETYRKGTEP
ncbi:hypothetical protein CHARACLAT_024400 [Characodon lateralis]|uniref:Uncharacterized protein n=1 Tax=Characodon lateralis TaxID=208331 RepID=A0ABU7DDT4_9TELE|nr:hypothetical protein [Characodon lateralis]